MLRWLRRLFRRQAGARTDAPNGTPSANAPGSARSHSGSGSAPTPDVPRPSASTAASPAPRDRAPRPAWAAGVPGKVLAFDVETTGLQRCDRVVSFGGVLFDSTPGRDGAFDFTCLHLVFDPGRESHPRAEEVHGFDDWTLRHQEPFGEQAARIAALFAQADLAVAHNAGFDLGFLDREFALLGGPPIGTEVHCTMRAFGDGGGRGSAKLDALAARMGLTRAGRRHGALEDAWLALMVYLRSLAPITPPPMSLVRGVAIANLRPVPPRPDGPVPRRIPARSRGDVAGAAVAGRETASAHRAPAEDFHRLRAARAEGGPTRREGEDGTGRHDAAPLWESFDDLRALKRAGRLDQALLLAMGLVERTEEQDRTETNGVAPSYYKRSPRNRQAALAGDRRWRKEDQE